MGPQQTIVQNQNSVLPRIGRIAAQHVSEYGPTLATEFTLLLSQVLAFKLAAHYLGKDGFSEYAVVRRLVVLIVPIPLLGIGVALPRYIGYSNGNQDKPAASRYYGAAIACVVIATLVCVLGINVFSNEFAFLFFGARDYAHFVFPLSTMIVGLSLHTIACGYFRGHLQLNRANALQFIDIALVPILVFMFAHHSLDHILLTIGSVWILIAGTTLTTTAASVPRRNISDEARELLRYGVQRVPGDFTLIALFTLPVTVVAHLQGVQQAGYLAFAISVLSMICAVFQPVGLVLLPKATHMLAEGSHRELRAHVSQLLKISVLISLVLTLFVALFATQLFRIYLGQGYEQVAGLVRIMVIGTIPYSIYLVLRNIIDAFHKNGVTALILLLSLAVFGGGVTLGISAGISSFAVMPSFLCGLVILAGSAVWECRRILHLTLAGTAT
jgi:O-antigen/teichoic acid export membrane protein